MIVEVLILLISIVNSLIWINYFKTIDIYEKEKWITLLSAFGLGISLIGLIWVYDVYLSEATIDFINTQLVKITGTEKKEMIFSSEYYSIEPQTIEIEVSKKSPLLDLFKYVFEEFVLRIILVFIVFHFFRLLFKKQLNEPLDYIISGVLIGVGFFNAEFFLIARNIKSQAIFTLDTYFIYESVIFLSSSALIAYAFVLYKYKTKNILLFPLYFIFSIVLYSLYPVVVFLNDFIFLPFWPLFQAIYVLFCISVFSTIINNSLNNSPFFDKKKILNSKRIRNQLLYMFGTLFFLQLLLNAEIENLKLSVHYLVIIIQSTGFVAFVSVVVLSYYKLIQGKWYPIRLEIPIYKPGKKNIAIKGFSRNESDFIPFYDTEFKMLDVSQNSDFLSNQKFRILQKLYFKGDELGFLAESVNDADNEKIILYPKLDGVITMENKYPIVGIYYFDESNDLSKHILKIKHFQFHGWKKMIPIEKEALVFN
ncbi:hypothetical protein [Aureivirga sp. CE67]|uniref:hypothetical protein n=1 Tax=Aureivirga sp. CE67 TaxID=1788983 RepID=UPI0018C90C68|nr:hypothetical protein [Aureivirga sp. CE67]